MTKLDYAYKGKEKEYRKQYRQSHKKERKIYDKKYNRIYYLRHRGKTIRNPRIPR